MCEPFQIVKERHRVSVPLNFVQDVRRNLIHRVLELAERCQSLLLLADGDVELIESHYWLVKRANAAIIKILKHVEDLFDQLKRGNCILLWVWEFCDSRQEAWKNWRHHFDFVGSDVYSVAGGFCCARAALHNFVKVSYAERNQAERLHGKFFI